MSSQISKKGPYYAAFYRSFGRVLKKPGMLQAFKRTSMFGRGAAKGKK